MPVFAGTTPDENAIGVMQSREHPVFFACGRVKKRQHTALPKAKRQGDQPTAFRSVLDQSDRVAGNKIGNAKLVGLIPNSTEIWLRTGDLLIQFKRCLLCGHHNLIAKDLDFGAA